MAPGHEDGLSTQDALRRLADVLSKPRAWHTHTRRTLRPAACIRPAALLALAALLVADGHSTGLVVAALVALCESLIFAGVMHRRAREFPARLKRISARVRALADSSGDAAPMFEYVHGRDPPSGAVRVARVLRDGAWRVIPQTLLVAGDVVDMHPGFAFPECGPNDIAPFLRPLDNTHSGADNDGAAFEVVHKAVVTAAPAERQLEVLSVTPPGAKCTDSRTVTASEGAHVLLAAITLADYVCGTRTAAAAALLCASVLLSPLWTLVSMAVSNARILLLFEAHAASVLSEGAKQAAAGSGFVETADTGVGVDEFDEDAPPPTKDISIPILSIALRVLKNVPMAAHSGDLFWTFDYAESLGTLSVLAFLDREGPIAMPFPLPFEMVLPGAESRRHARALLSRTFSRNALHGGDSGAVVAAPQTRNGADNSESLPGSDGRDHHSGGNSAPRNGSEKEGRSSSNTHSNDEDASLVFAELIVRLDNPQSVRTYVLQDEPATLDGAHRSRRLNARRLRRHARALGLAAQMSSHNPAPAACIGRARDWHARVAWDAPERAHAPFGPVFATCCCFVGHALGLAPSAVLGYRDGDWAYVGGPHPSPFVGVYERRVTALGDKDSSEMQHVFSIGDMPSVLARCGYAWSGVSRSIVPLNGATRSRLQSLAASLPSVDVGCVAFSYAPEAARAESTGGRRTLRNGGVFLGALLAGYEPKDAAQELVDDLENCGVRWVYFSPLGERATKAFGERLGLETSWNSCIVLGGAGSEVSSDDDDKARMPRGVANVRPHLQAVDDIPLHVSLFAECTAPVIAEMLDIYGEWDESVVAVGSALDWTTPAAMAHARLAISMAPRDALVASVQDRTGEESRLCCGETSLAVAAEIGAVSAPLSGLSFDASPYIFTEMVREGRRLEGSRRSMVRSAVSLAVALALWPVGCALLGLADARPLIPFLVVLGSVLAAAQLAGPCEPMIMRLMPLPVQSVSGQAQAGSADFAPAMTREALQFFLRSLLSVLALVCASFLDAFANGWWALYRGGAFRIGARPPPCAVSALLGVCASHIHATLPVSEDGPLQHRAWSYIAVIGALCASVYEAVWTLSSPMQSVLVVVCRSMGVHALSLAAGLAGNEAVKALWWRGEVERGVKRAKLHFSTRLGMHSPV